jgi:hypothetical protein
LSPPKLTIPPRSSLPLSITYHPAIHGVFDNELRLSTEGGEVHGISLQAVAPQPLQVFTEG